jgi:hypothetical protein
MSLRQLETLVDQVGVWIPRTGLGNFLTPCPRAVVAAGR